MIVSPNLSTQIYPDESRAKEALSESLRQSSSVVVGPPAAAASVAAVDPARNAQIRGLDEAQQQVGNAISFTQTQSAYLDKTSEALQRMSALAGLARDADSDTERGSYQSGFSQLCASIAAISDRDFNGVSLFSGHSLAVPLDSTGNTLTMPGVNLAGNVYIAALNAGLNSASEAQDALDKTQRASTQLSQDRAGVVANQSRLTLLAAGQLAAGRENLTPAASRLQDEDAAEASAESAKQNILAQPGAAMLAQANAMPQSALRVLP